MSARITIGQLYRGAITPGSGKKSNASVSSTSQSTNTKSFQSLLQEQLVISHHAETRLQQRGIQLGPEQMNKLEKAIDNAAAKGAKDSLFLMNGLAFIVNITNRTVITAMDQHSMKDNVFTQIDSAVVIS